MTDCLLFRDVTIAEVLSGITAWIVAFVSWKGNGTGVCHGRAIATLMIPIPSISIELSKAKISQAASRLHVGLNSPRYAI